MEQRVLRFHLVKARNYGLKAYIRGKRLIVGDSNWSRIWSIAQLREMDRQLSSSHQEVQRPVEEGMWQSAACTVADNVQSDDNSDLHTLQRNRRRQRDEHLVEEDGQTADCRVDTNPGSSGTPDDRTKTLAGKDLPAELNNSGRNDEASRMSTAAPRGGAEDTSRRSMTRALLLWILAVSLSSGICYDPDDYLTTPQIIRRHGYSVESHTVLTDDGYLLTLHRITGSPNRRFHTTTPRQPTISYPTAVSANKTTTTSYKMSPENSAATSYSQISLPPEPSTTTQTNSYYRERRIQRLKKFLLFAKNETIGIHQRWKQRGISLKLQNMVKYGATQTTSSTQTTTAAVTTVTTPQAIIVQTTTQTTPSAQITRPTMPTKTTVETITTTLQTTSIQATTPQTTSSTQATTPQTTTPKTTSLPTTTVSPSPPSSSPIFIQHGLLGSSADWIMAGPGRALAYLLADEGYDVWLGNARGNVYSRAHATLSTSDSKFWNFSWHEMGYYDLPAAIDYMINVTGSSSLVYIGHSMGTTMFYVMAASRPEYNAKIRAMFSLAPVAYVHYIKSPIRLIARYAHDVEFICHILGQNEFLPQGKIMNLLAKYGCLLVATEKIICENAIFLMTGFDAVQFDKALLPLILMHTPAGTSTKTVLHYAQEVQSGKFRQYDYGTRDNWKFYNQSSPPEYNLSLITAPIELYYAKNDWLATPKDVEEFYLKLKNRIGKYLVKLPQFNHLDFLWAKDVKTLVYDELIDRIKQFSPPLSEKKETLKVTSKWYSDIKGEYSHEKYPHEVRRNFQGLKR